VKIFQPITVAYLVSPTVIAFSFLSHYKTFAIIMERDYMSVVCSSAASMPSNTTVTPNMRTSSGAAPLQPNQTGPLQSGPPHHHPISAVGCMASRILSRNANGTSKSMAQPLCHSNTLLVSLTERSSAMN
jgi:hypothetical protein